MTLSEFLDQWNDPTPYLSVQTSGSTGEPKTIHVEKHRMENSARRTCSLLGLQRGDTALLCMPVDYIAGKMMVVRALLFDLKLIDVGPSGHPMASLPDEDITFAAMVPMQVYNTLQADSERAKLMRIKHLLIGGGDIHSTIERELQQMPGTAWATYGMTETLSNIAYRRINGPAQSLWYTPYPGVKITLSLDKCLQIYDPNVCDHHLQTNDIAEMNPDGYKFRILGRKDNIINSGGYKIQTEEIERVLHDYLKESFLISKRPDRKFGEIVVLLTEGGDEREILNTCQRVLPKYWCPRSIIKVPCLPLTKSGKPSRILALQIAATGSYLDV